MLVYKKRINWLDPIYAFGTTVSAVVLFYSDTMLHLPLPFLLT